MWTYIGLGLAGVTAFCTYLKVWKTEKKFLWHDAILFACTLLGLVVSGLGSKEAQLQSDTQNKSISEQYDLLYAGTKKIENTVAPISRFNPKIVHMQERTTQKKDRLTGKYKTTFIFQAEHPIAVRDILIDLRFDVPIDSASAQFISDPMSKDLFKLQQPDKKRIVFRVDHLDDTGHIAITTVSKLPPKIMSHNLSPSGGDMHYVPSSTTGIKMVNQTSVSP